MPVCRMCSGKFPARAVIDGKKRNLCTRQYCLECSPFGAHNTRKLEAVFAGVCNCETCGRKFAFDRQKGHQYKTCNSCITEARHSDVKRRCVEYLGGRCVGCGYNRCLKALEFHHKDPEMKDFGIGGAYNRSWKSIKAELDRCVLTCANCHREHHDGLRDLLRPVSSIG